MTGRGDQCSRRAPFKAISNLENEEKSTGAESRLYRGWGSVATPILTSNSETMSVAWHVVALQHQIVELYSL